jgi:hypothetical protein
LYNDNGTKGVQVRTGGVDDSLVCQPWSDLGWRAIPLVGNIYFVNKFGAEVDASACEAFVGKRRKRASFCSEGRSIWGDEGWGVTASRRRGGDGGGGGRVMLETTSHGSM